MVDVDDETAISEDEMVDTLGRNSKVGRQRLEQMELEDSGDEDSGDEETTHRSQQHRKRKGSELHSSKQSKGRRTFG